MTRSMSVDVKDLLTATQAAELAGIERDTFTSYVSRGLAPESVMTIGRQRMYARPDIVKWMKDRPGSGARTDLRKKQTTKKP